MADLNALERSLAIARAGLAPPEGARARIRAKLGAAALPAAAPARLATAAKAGGVTKVTTATLVGVGFLVGYWLGLRHSAEPPVRGAATEQPAPARTAAPLSGASAGVAPPGLVPESAPTAAAPAAPAPRTPSVGLDSPTPLGPRTASARAPARHTPSARSGTTPAHDPFADELALLERAERAIRSDQAALALSFLDDLDQRFPKSSLLEERTAARVLADCALGEPPARARAELFLRDRQASVYTDRVRRLCRLDALPPTLP